VLTKHLTGIAEKKVAKWHPRPLRCRPRRRRLGARRVSLLDRALAHVDLERRGESGRGGTRTLLGLADRTQVFDLFER